MTIKQQKDGTKLTVYIEGSIDTNTAPQLMDYLEEEMPKVSDLVLDFSGVDYISSAGLRVLLYTKKTMNGRGEVALTNVNEDVMETFEITNFTDIITII